MKPINPCKVLRTGDKILHENHGEGRIHYLVDNKNNWLFNLSVNKINHIKVMFINLKKIVDVFPKDISLKEL